MPEYQFSMHLYVCRARGVNIHGVKYMCDSIVRVKSTQPDILPFVYAQIEDVYVYHNHKVLLTHVVEVVSHEQQLRSIKVFVTQRPLLCHSTNLYCRGVLHLKQRGQETYLIERDHWSKHTLFY